MSHERYVNDIFKKFKIEY